MEHIMISSISDSNLPSDNRAAGIGGNSVRVANANNARAKNGAYSPSVAKNGGEGNNSSQGKANQPYLFPYTSQVFFDNIREMLLVLDNLFIGARDHNRYRWK